MKKLILIALSLFLISACNKPDPHAGHEHGTHDDHSDHSGHDHAAHDDKNSHEEDLPHEQEGNVEISIQAMKNMGVEIEEVDSSNYSISSSVPASLMEHPLSERPIYAPFAGRVKDISLEPGQYLKQGEFLLSLIRAPIKRIELKMIEEILKPASEEYHESITELRKHSQNLKLLRLELARLEKFSTPDDGLSVVPQKELIDLRYAIIKAEQSLKNSRVKLSFHGLSAEDVKRLEKGGKAVHSPNLWLNALKQNQIWTAKSESVFKLLPKELQTSRWAVATIGELSAEDLLNDDFFTYLKNRPSARQHFLEIASLLQAGHSLTDIENLERLSAFDKVIKIKVPMNKKGWDLQGIHIKKGQVVGRGEKLLTLLDPQKMILVAKPTGSELLAINQAFSLMADLEAQPLLEKTSPVLKNLKLAKLGSDGHQQAKLLVPVKNIFLSLTKVDGVEYRNWQLRPGLKYFLQVPTRQLEDVIVLPAEAVIEHGADKVVFVREAETFIRRKVIVLYQNDQVAVIGEGSELLPEEAMVVRGAFALQLALISGTPQAVDPHAGHNH